MEWLVSRLRKQIPLIDALALLVILGGTSDCFIRAVPLIFSTTGHRRREVWLRYARWLIAGHCFRVGWCDFLDRLGFLNRPTIPEVTLSNTERNTTSGEN